MEFFNSAVDTLQTIVVGLGGALCVQAFLIMIVVGIYAVLIRNISGAADIAGAIWGCMGYTVLLCFCLFKTGSISKSVFGAH